MSSALFLVCALVLTLLLARSLVAQSDEGYTLNAAWQLWNGLKMYDDFRLFVGPGSGYAIFLLWKLVGNPSQVAARWLSLGFAFSSTVALFLLLRRLGIAGLNLAITIVIWLLVSSLYVPLNHNSFSSYAAIWFLLPFLRLTHACQDQQGNGELNGSRVTVDAALSGVAVGVVFLILPPKGGLLVGAAIAFVLALGSRQRASRPALVLLGAFLLVVAPVFLRWGPAALVRQWLIIPLTGDYIGHTSASWKFTVAAILLVAGLLGTAFRRGDRTLEALALVQTALFASMSHNMELNHFAINAFPTVIFLSLVAHRLLGRPPQTLPQRLGFSSTAALAGVTGTLLAWTVFTSAGAKFLTTSALNVDLLGHRPKAFSNPRIIAAHAIYAGPFLPGLYYLLKKNNPFFVSETVVCNDDCQRLLVAQLTQVKPELAFLDYEMVAHLNYRQTGPVDVYLRDHYTACPGHGGIAVRALAPGWCP